MATVGTIEVIASIDTSGYKKGAAEVDAANKNIEGSTERGSKNMNSALMGVAKVGWVALAAGAVAATAVVVKNIDGAVKRIDTLVSFPRVLQALGVSSEEAQASTKELSDSLQGLPTALSEGARGVQGFVTSGLDVNKATDAFLGLNNAMLAAGVETGAAQATMQQLNQALSRGRIDGEEWNSIAANIPTVLQALQNETGKSKDELREMFREDPQALLDNIIRLNQEGGGGLASLDEQARNATGGIGTAFANLDNAVQRGMQNIVTAIGGGDLEAGQKTISDFITNLGKSFGDGLTKVGEFVKFLIDNKDVVLPIVVAVGAFVGVVTALATAIKIASAAQVLFNTVFAANPIGLIITAIAALVAGLVYFFTQTETGKQVWQGFMDFMGQVWAAITGFFSAAWATISGIWGAVVGFFTGIWGGIVSVFSSVSSWFSSIFSAAWNGIKAVWSAVTGWFGNVFNGIVSFFSNIPGMLGSFFRSAWNSVTNAWSGAGGWFSGVVSGIIGWFKDIPGKIKGFFNDAWDSVTSINWLQLGADIISGIVNGLNPSRVVDKMKEIASSAMDTVKSFLGIKSPSRVFMEIGGDIMAGWAKGMDAKPVVGAMNSATSQLMRAASPLDNLAMSGSYNVTGGGAFDNMNGSNGGISNNINTVNIASEVDGERWLRRLNGNQEIVSNGLVPTQSYM